MLHSVCLPLSVSHHHPYTPYNKQFLQTYQITTIYAQQESSRYFLEFRFFQFSSKNIRTHLSHQKKKSYFIIMNESLNWNVGSNARFNTGMHTRRDEQERRKAELMEHHRSSERKVRSDDGNVERDWANRVILKSQRKHVETKNHDSLCVRMNKNKSMMMMMM